MSPADLPLIDMIALTVVFLAIVRGIWIGLIREGLSLASIGIATIVTRLLVDPLAERLISLTGGEVTGKTALWIAGVLLVVATILLLGVVAKLIKRSAVYAGLGWADRLGGGALGAAEGSIVAAVMVLLAVWLVGPDHAATEGARSVELVQQFRDRHEDELTGALPDSLPDVGSPGDWF